MAVAPEKSGERALKRNGRTTAGVIVALLVWCLMAASASARTAPPPPPPAEYPEPPSEFNPLVEAENFSITQQRQALYDTPEYQTALSEATVTNLAEATGEQTADTERNFADDLCWNGGNGCAGDVRLDDWEKNGDGIVRHVLFTSRGGATLSGESGPRSKGRRNDRAW